MIEFIAIQNVHLTNEELKSGTSSKSTIYRQYKLDVLPRMGEKFLGVSWCTVQDIEHLPNRGEGSTIRLYLEELDEDEIVTLSEAKQHVAEEGWSFEYP